MPYGGIMDQWNKCVCVCVCVCMRMRVGGHMFIPMYVNITI